MLVIETHVYMEIISLNLAANLIWAEIFLFYNREANKWVCCAQCNEYIYQDSDIVTTRPVDQYINLKLITGCWSSKITKIITYFWSFVYSLVIRAIQRTFCTPPETFQIAMVSWQVSISFTVSAHHWPNIPTHHTWQLLLLYNYLQFLIYNFMQ